MSEYSEVEKPFLEELRTLGWKIIDQGPEIPQNPARSRRHSFRQVLLPDIFNDSIRALNPWLTDRQLQDLQDQLHRSPTAHYWKPTSRHKNCCSKPRWMYTRRPGNRTRWLH